MPFHQEQLEFMLKWAQIRPDFLKPILLFLNFFDTPYFFFILIPIVWLSISYQWGLRLFYWMVCNSLLNAGAKDFFGWPRPSSDVDWIGLFQPASNGFPSGGAQGAIFLAALLAYYGKMPRTAFCYVLIISLSRVLLGVHYPIDVLGGLVLGALVFLAFFYLHEPIEKRLKQMGLTACLALSIALPLCLMELVHGTNYIAWSMIGIGIGSCISIRHHLFLPPAKTMRDAISRSLLGITAIFLLVFLWPKGLYPSFAAAFFMSLGICPICKSVLKTRRS